MLKYIRSKKGKQSFKLETPQSIPKNKVNTYGKRFIGKTEYVFMIDDKIVSVK